MRGLATLLRLNTNRTEAIRVALADAIRDRHAAVAALQAQEAASLAETGLIGDRLAEPEAPVAEALRDWSAWRRRARREAVTLHGEVAALAGLEEERRAAMRDSVADGKRLELALAARAREARRAAARRQEVAAEEQALQRAGSGRAEAED